MDGISSTVELQRPVQKQNAMRNGRSPKRERGKSIEKGILVKQKMRRNHILNVQSKENRLESTSIIPNTYSLQSYIL